MADDQGWRLKAELQDPQPRGALDHLLGRLRGPDVAADVAAAVDHEVAVTHDGSLLFAYAASEPALSAARAAIEGVLQRDGVGAQMWVSRWDEEREEWVQTDPPLSGEELAARDAADRDEEAVESRTLVATSGNAIRSEFEQTMVDWAQKLGLECEVIEHPHMLSTQVVFTVKGTRRALNEFTRGLAAEGTATMRTDAAVMLSPL